MLTMLALLAVSLFVIDRVLLALELRGWITYRRTPRARHGFGMSVMTLDALLQPERRHVIELQQEGETYREADDEAERRKRRTLLADDPARDGSDTDGATDGSGQGGTRVPAVRSRW